MYIVYVITNAGINMKSRYVYTVALASANVVSLRKLRLWHLQLLDASVCLHWAGQPFGRVCPLGCRQIAALGGGLP